VPLLVAPELLDVPLALRLRLRRQPTPRLVHRLLVLLVRLSHDMKRPFTRGSWSSDHFRGLGHAISEGSPRLVHRLLVLLVRLSSDRGSHGHRGSRNFVTSAVGGLGKIPSQ
jgi:hypothetical protein